MTNPKTITINDILRPQELDKARIIFNSDYPNFHKRVIEELIVPNLTRINSSLGQNNDPRYLSYVIEAAFIRWSGTNAPAAKARRRRLPHSIQERQGD